MAFNPFSRRDPVRVQPFFGYRNAGRLFLNARAIRSREPVFEKRSFMRDFATMIGQYLSKEVPDLTVELHYELPCGRTLQQGAVSGPEGYVRFDLDLTPESPQPPRTRWEKALVRWHREDGSQGEAPAYILSPGSETQMGVISDIDDTILETGITGNLRAISRNWKRVMAQMPSERVLVRGATSFYAAIGGNPAGSREPAAAIDALIPEARVRPVFYVSSSPWNLFSYLVTFQKERGLPLGPVMLRDWGFNRRTLGKAGHGSHKLQSITRILNTFPRLKFALIGDDTQKDLAAFAAITQQFPGRVAAIFIRRVSEEALNEESEAALQTIEKAGLPFWSGNDFSEVEAFLECESLDFEGGVERLIQTPERGE